MQKLKNLIGMLERAECHEEADFVRSLAQQRADLLEALKMLFEDADSTCETYYIAKEAITKAEAAE